MKININQDIIDIAVSGARWRILRSVMRSGSSLVISLPRIWVKSVGLRSGDQVEVRVAGNSLIVSPMVGEELQEIRLEYKGDIRAMINKIVAAYLLGYDSIDVIIPKQLRNDLEKELLSVKDRLMGLETVEEKEANITLRMTIDPLGLKPSEILRRMWRISNDMLNDALESLLNHDLKRSKLLEMREEDMDRLYFYMVRILRKSALNPVLRAALRLSSLELLDYRLAAYFLENIADKAYELIKFIDIDQGKLQRNMKRVSEILLESHHHSMDAFLNGRLDALLTIKKNLEELTKLLTLPNLSYEQLRLRDIFLGIAEMQHDIANLLRANILLQKSKLSL